MQFSSNWLRRASSSHTLLGGEDMSSATCWLTSAGVGITHVRHFTQEGGAGPEGLRPPGARPPPAPGHKACSGEGTHTVCYGVFLWGLSPKPGQTQDRNQTATSREMYLTKGVRDPKHLPPLAFLLGAARCVSGAPPKDTATRGRGYEKELKSRPRGTRAKRPGRLLGEEGTHWLDRRTD